MKLLTKRLFFGIAIVGSLLFTSATTTFAHRSPTTCLGSGLNINLFVNPSQASVGDVITYDADIFNGMGIIPVSCDATNITASIITPDGVTHPLILNRTSLSNMESDSYSHVVSYTIRPEDAVSGNTIAASGHVSGTIHQNVTDSIGGGDQGVNVQIVAQSILLPPSPPSTSGPVSTSSGGGCYYGFNFDLQRCNYTPLVPATAPSDIPTFPHTGFGPDEQGMFLVNLTRTLLVLLTFIFVICTRKVHSIGS